MRDEQHGAGVVLEILLEPDEREQVEVVRGLVEHQQIGLHDEQAREVRAHHPAAGKLARQFREIRLAKAQPGQHLLRLRLDLRVAQRLVLGVGLEIRRAGNVARLLAGVQDFLQRLDLAGPARGHIHRRHLALHLGFLREVAERGPLIAVHRPGIRVLGVQDDVEERGFSRAVRPDQRDLFAIADLHGGVLKEHAPPVAFL